MTDSDRLRDSAVTLLAFGVLADVFETMGHEAIGHGSVCLVSGGRLTALAPLWMNCSVVNWPMVLAGPLFNLAFGAACLVGMRTARPASQFAWFFWLCAAFNLLVAFGYAIVGGVTQFGDWNALLSGVAPAWSWRGGVTIVGVVGYWLSLNALARLYHGRIGFLTDTPALRRRTLLPGLAAAVVALGAEIAGGRTDPTSLAIAGAAQSASV